MNKQMSVGTVLLWSFLAVKLCIVVWACNLPEADRNNLNKTDDILIRTKSLELYIDLDSALPETNRSEAATIQIAYDPNFKQPKQYKAFSLSALLDSAITARLFDTTNAVVVFDCTDGFQPSMEISKCFGKANGYLAFREAAPDSVLSLSDSLADTFAPYYLVWENVTKGDRSFAWPYGVKGIRIISPGVAYRYIYPFKNQHVRTGFHLFRDNCMQCHSINQNGGRVGPEFNIPKNITEYWSEKDIVSFARNPAAYRSNARMPAITSLSDSEFHEIVDYLKYMKEYKIEK